MKYTFEKHLRKSVFENLKGMKVPDILNLRISSSFPSIFLSKQHFKHLDFFMFQHISGRKFNRAFVSLSFGSKMSTTLTFSEWSLCILWTNNSITNIYPKRSFKTRKNTLHFGQVFISYLFRVQWLSSYAQEQKPHFIAKNE